MPKLSPGIITHGVVRQAKKAGWLDIGLGKRLMSDRRVPFSKKGIAVALGFALTAVIILLELPVEAMIDALLPVAGLALTITFDGIEQLLLPFLIAFAILPRLVSKETRSLV